MMCVETNSMRTPTNFEYNVVLTWQENRTVFWFSDRMRELEHDAAWRLVQVMVAYAPSTDVLALIAAGPVEDLFGLVELMRDEAEKNARFRICLGHTYGLPPQL